ncbi:hypothetical protein BDQ17DRAFT_1370992, partial [Cyathus striatus]
IPCLDSTGAIGSWRSVTYSEFHRDVELYARYWTHVLRKDGTPRKSIIGLWLSGSAYTDVLHIYGISHAGYVPQLFNLHLPNPEVVYELLQRAGAKALIYLSSFESEHEIAFVFHTSGSASGFPKLVPCTYRWLDTVIQKSRVVCTPRNRDRQDVTVFIGSMCHIAQNFLFIGTLQYGSCVVQPTATNFSSDELIDMIVRCGLNRLNQFPTFLVNHFRKAREDPKLLSMLASLDDILYSGLALPREENIFGSTEAGGMLLSGSNERHPALLAPLPGFSYRFVPAGSSPDEVVPGHYLFRGRDDDWIQSENSLRCDAMAIENNARATCRNLISECVVVGSGRPSPVIFIEPSVEMDHNKFKKEIIRKTRAFHSRRYLHERIISIEMVVIVPPHTLPRTATKGNIRRLAVEEAFKVQLDQIFNCSSPFLSSACTYDITLQSVDIINIWGMFNNAGRDSVVLSNSNNTIYQSYNPVLDNRLCLAPFSLLGLQDDRSVKELPASSKTGFAESSSTPTSSSSIELPSSELVHKNPSTSTTSVPCTRDYGRGDEDALKSLKIVINIQVDIDDRGMSPSERLPESEELFSELTSPDVMGEQSISSITSTQDYPSIEEIRRVLSVLPTSRKPDLFKVLSFLMHSFDDLPLPSITSLLFPDDPSSLRELLNFVGLIVSIPHNNGPLRFTHPSLKWFFSDRSCAGGFFVGCVQGHRILLQSCTEYMKQLSWASRGDGIRSVGDQALEYACRYWEMHKMSLNMLAKL